MRPRGPDCPPPGESHLGEASFCDWTMGIGQQGDEARNQPSVLGRHHGTLAGPLSAGSALKGRWLG